MVAAPILKECDDMDLRCLGFILDSTVANPDLVRKRPSCQVKRGPVLLGCEARNEISA